MVNLINARDTFLKFLGDNLTGIDIHPLRKSTTEVETDTFKINAINVEFLSLSGSYRQLGSQQVVITIIHENEATAVSWIQSIYSLLSSAFYTPLLSYSVPSAPVAANGNLYWRGTDVTFRTIPSGRFARYECALDLEFIQ